jgi:probable HAF family extracellular repeat protein
MIDLGTLGGNRAGATALNDSGQVVGYSFVADNAAPHAFLWEDGVMRDLSLVDDMSSGAGVITNSGRIAGANLTDRSPQSHVFLWINGVRTDLGSTKGDRVGVVGITASNVLAWADDGEHYVSTIWQDGVRRELGGLNGWPYALARAMNSRGQVVGSSTVDDVVGMDIVHPFIWENGVMRPLRLLGEPPCDQQPAKTCGLGEARDINSRGDIVGNSSTLGQGSHGVLWTGDSIIDLGAWQAVAINESREIIGYGIDVSFYWYSGTTITLPSLGGGGTVVTDMNDRGMVVGWSLTASGEHHAFVWRRGDAALTDLGSGHAVAINARGDVLGGTWPPLGRAILWRLKDGS